MRIPAQLTVTLGVLLLGGLAIGGEYFGVHFYPHYRDSVEKRTLQLLPYHSDALGIDMKVAGGIYGKVKDSSGSVKIFRPRLLGGGPSITIKSEPVSDPQAQLSPYLLALWQASGTIERIPGYRFEHTVINGRDAAIVWRPEESQALVTAHLLAPNRRITVVCSTGTSDLSLLVEACESSISTIKIIGPPTPPPKTPLTPFDLTNIKIG